MFLYQGNNSNSKSNPNTNNSNNHKSPSQLQSECHSILSKYFGYQSFRANQLQVILNIIKGNDNLVVMATGSGKSLCYQIPPLIQHKPALIISPLISLIQNQVDALLSKGIKAIAVTTASRATYDDYKDAFEKNKYSVIYLTPEGLDSQMDNIRKLHKKHGISVFAIDESHCVSEWGHDFRPAYKQLFKLRNAFPSIPICALTATATTQVQDEIIKILKLGQNGHRLNRIVSSFNRTNLTYELREKKSIIQDLCLSNTAKEFYSRGSTIIYTTNRKESETVAEKLEKFNYTARAYHGGMNNNDRTRVQNEWEQGEVQCIVATIAFGMGIDKPDIRYVLHYGMPDSIEAYYQHTGRAGRDGNPSKCILFWSKGDFSKANWRAGHSNSAFNQDRILKQTQKMKQFTYTRECRIKYILSYFGEHDFTQCGTRCDNCLEKQKNASNPNVVAMRARNGNNQVPKERDFTDDGIWIIKGVRDTGQRFGISAICSILKGTETSKVKKMPWLKEKECFGKLEDKSADWIKAVYRKIVELGFLKEVWHNPSPGRGGYGRRGGGKAGFMGRGYQCPNVTELGWKVIRRQIRIPPWIPDKDIVKAEAKLRTKTRASSKFKYAGNRNRSNNSNLNSNSSQSPASNRDFSKWSFNGNAMQTPSRKRSYSQISDGDGGGDAKRRRILPSCINTNTSGSSYNDTLGDNINTINVTPESVAALTRLKIGSGIKPKLMQSLTGDEFKEKLISARKRLATKNGMIAYQIVSNEGIDLLDKHRPSSVENLRLMAKESKGIIGEQFIKRFGPIFTGYIKKYCQQNKLLVDIDIKDENGELINKNVKMEMEEEKDNNFSSQTTATSVTSSAVSMPQPMIQAEEEEEVVEEDINDKIIVAPKNGSNAQFDLTLPQVTNQSKEIYALFQDGLSIADIIKKRTLTRTTVEKCLSDMVINGYKIDWNRLPFNIEQIKIAFDALATMGIGTGYDQIRSHNTKRLGEFTDSQIDLVIGRYIADNFTKPKSRNHGKKWQVEDDARLWQMRDDCVIDLANKFGRAATSIQARLDVLRDQDHKWHGRLMDYYGCEFGQSIVSCNNFHEIPSDIGELLEYKKWSVEEDLCLYSNRDCCTEILSRHFGVKRTLIIHRLMDLSGVDLAARSRMEKWDKMKKEVEEDGYEEDVDMKMKEVVNETPGNEIKENEKKDGDEGKEGIIKGVNELLSKTKDGVSWDEFMGMNVKCENKENVLKQVLEELSDSFVIYQKNNKFFSF